MPRVFVKEGGGGGSVISHCIWQSSLLSPLLYTTANIGLALVTRRARANVIRSAVCRIVASGCHIHIHYDTTHCVCVMLVALGRLLRVSRGPFLPLDWVNEVPLKCSSRAPRALELAKRERKREGCACAENYGVFPREIVSSRARRGGASSARCIPNGSWCLKNKVH